MFIINVIVIAILIIVVITIPAISIVGLAGHRLPGLPEARGPAAAAVEYDTI